MDRPTSLGRRKHITPIQTNTKYIYKRHKNLDLLSVIGSSSNCYRVATFISASYPYVDSHATSANLTGKLKK